ncbi:MAG: MBL fold metallo-hydrolase [Candidatus Nanohaloarchaea archaeon]
MKAEILGTAQDGGVPHLGCSCDTCTSAREDPSEQRYASSLRVHDEEKGVNYLFDVSPDVRFQVGEEYIDGVFLSHAHLGHVTGLLYFGKESFNADNIPVHCSTTVRSFLEDNPPYRLLIDRNNIEVKEFRPGQTVSVMGINVTPVQVENKGYVTTDTNAFIIDSGDRELFYMTDIDEWTDEALERVKQADVAIVDGCFWSREEIDRYENVPHPPIEESLEVLEGVETEVYFTHLNHTNPVLDPDSEERKKIEDKGFKVAEEGMEIEL